MWTGHARKGPQIGRQEKTLPGCLCCFESAHMPLTPGLSDERIVELVNITDIGAKSTLCPRGRSYADNGDMRLHRQSTP